MVNQVIAFPTYNERLKKRILEQLKQKLALTFFDQEIKSELTNYFEKVLGLHFTDETMPLTFNLNDGEFFTQNQKDSILNTFEECFESMRSNTEALLIEIILLSMQVATLKQISKNNIE